MIENMSNKIPIEMPIEIMAQSEQQCVAGFISKTYSILNDQEYSKIIQWEKNGNEFWVKDVDKFEQTVLPKYFRHKKMNSFVRQLNMYGFHKSRKDNSKCIFSHNSFIKGREDLLITIKRKIKQDLIPATITTLAAPETPIKQKTQHLKLTPSTSFKQLPSISTSNLNIELAPQPNQIFSSYLNLESKNKLNSFINLNMSLNQISANNLCIFEEQQNEDQQDNTSIADEVEQKDNEENEKKKSINIINIVNPSFFFF